MPWTDDDFDVCWNCGTPRTASRIGLESRRRPAEEDEPVAEESTAFVKHPKVALTNAGESIRFIACVVVQP